MPHNYSADHIDPDDYLSFSQAVARRTHFVETRVFDMDDAVSAGAEALCQAQKTYDPSRGWAFRTYAYQRVRWGILGQYRNQFPYYHGTYDPDKDKMIAFVSLDDPLPGSSDGDGEMLIEDVIPDPCVYDWASSLDVQDALKQLSPQQAQAVKLFYWEGRTGGEIGQVMGLGKGTIDDYLQRAKKKLKLILEGGTPRVYVMHGKRKRVPLLTSEVARV